MNVKKIFFMVGMFVAHPVLGIYYHHFVFITASYNNATRYKDNLDSMLSQDYPSSKFRIIYMDDCSPDRTGSYVRKYLQQRRKKIPVTLVLNKRRRGQLANIYDATHTCKDSEIVVIVDGDDKLVGRNVLSYLNSIYQDPFVWLTYGQYRHYCADRKNPLHHRDGISQPFPEHIIQKKAFRLYPGYIISHPRTYHAWLFKQIKLKDLLYKSYFFPSATDVAAMFPMIEMAGDKFRFLDKILYRYTCPTKVRLQQPFLLGHIKRKKPYAMVSEPVVTKRSASASCVVLIKSKHQALRWITVMNTYASMKPIVFCKNKVIYDFLLSLAKGKLDMVTTEGELFDLLMKKVENEYVFIIRSFVPPKTAAAAALSYQIRSHSEMIIFGERKLKPHNKDIFPHISVLDTVSALELLSNNSMIVPTSVFLNLRRELLDEHFCKRNRELIKHTLDQMMMLYYRVK